ncbi:hypothetical protein BURK1_03239 [Burkholderiales bacterium]|nr:hypothetical protein BURK1_03239 [Burkholderiales bacterium]
MVRAADIGRSWAGAFNAAALAVALAFAPDAPAQKLYKWTDENGVVHYTDKAPDTARGGEVLDKQGRTVRRIEPPPTPEQVRAKAADEDKRRALEREQEVVARRDRALLSSYTTEAEIDLARARAVATVESQIESAQAYLAQLTRRKQDIDSRKAWFKDKPVPPQLERESEGADSEYTKNSDLVVQKRRELAAVTARYDADKARWRELKALQDANAAAARASNRPTALAPTARK